MKNGLNFCNDNVVKISLADDMFHKVSNKGMQPKWHKGNNWIKMDTNRYEGLAETIVSDMLIHSNMDRYFSYEPVKIEYKNMYHTGCISPNGLNENEELITLYKLMKLSNSPFCEHIDNNYDYDSPKNYIAEFTHESRKMTGLVEIDRCYAKMFELDAITLNNDRHMNNICVVRNFDNKRIDYGPIFDNGNALALAHENVQKWKDGESIQDIIASVEGKPFSTDFDTQRKIFENGEMELMLYYGPEDLERSLNRCKNIYDEQVLQFAKNVFEIQYNRYRDFFFDKNREKWKEAMEREIGMKATEKKHEIVFALDEKEVSVTPSARIKLNGKETENLYEIYDQGKDVFELYKKVNIVSNRLNKLHYDEQDMGLMRVEVNVEEKKNESMEEKER